MAYFEIVLAAMAFSSLYGHKNHHKKFETFVKNVTKSPFFSSKPPYYSLQMSLQHGCNWLADVGGRAHHFGAFLPLGEELEEGSR